MEVNTNAIEQLDKFVQGFFDSNGGYLNLKKLMEDNMLTIDTNQLGEESLNQENDVIYDEDKLGITFRYGIIHEFIDHVLQGIGRKIYVKFQKEFNEHGQEKIFQFDINQCVIQEGLFHEDKLSGLGRMIDKTDAKFGYFQKDLLQGYGKKVLLNEDNMTQEGIFNQDFLTEDKYDDGNEDNYKFEELKFNFDAYVHQG